MEKAELLRDTDANLLPALLRLQELVRKCIRLFVLSSEPVCCCTVQMMKRDLKSLFCNE